MIIERWVPLIGWLRTYHRGLLTRDVLAAVIVTLMLVPQALAYAMLAGLPPEMGLYASMLPLVLYAVFGTSASLAVGPVAVAALMTASALSSFAAPGSPEYICAALVLAALSGLILIAMGVLRLGFLVNFLSHPVISGFVTASGILIAISQLKHIFGVEASGHKVVELLRTLLDQWQQVNVITVLIVLGVWAYLWVCRKRLNGWLTKLGMPASWAGLMVKAAPISAVVVTTLLAWGFQLEQRGVDLVGFVPSGLPAITLPSMDQSLWLGLLPAALLISLVGFVESVSVAQTLAAKRRQRIDSNAELIGLGTANLASGVSGGFPVTGGFSRSVVNFDAGARSPMAGVFTAGGIALTALLFTPWFYYLPKATLAATIIVAVLALVDLGALRRAWRYSKADFTAMLVTLAGVLLAGVEIGVIAGVGAALALHLWRTSQPHMAELGQMPGTEHFRNVRRHPVITSPRVLSIRVDESLYFANARRTEDAIYDMALNCDGRRHVVLLCSAINHIDASALDSLESLNRRLLDAGVTLHLSEVKGPVMDQLKRSDFLEQLSGEVFMTHYQALATLDPETSERAADDRPHA